MALGNLLEALVVVGISSACVLDAVDVASSVAQTFSMGLASVPAPMLISLLLPMTETHVSSRMEKCPYARGVD